MNKKNAPAMGKHRQEQKENKTHKYDTTAEKISQIALMIGFNMAVLIGLCGGIFLLLWLHKILMGVIFHA